jgi:hypothetical protein
LAFANVFMEESNVDATSFTTAGNLTASANRLYLAAVFVTASGTPTAPTLTGGGMTTWTVVNNTTRTTGGLWVFRSLQASPGAAAPLVVDGGAQTYTSFSVVVDERDSVDTGGTNGADAIAQTNSANASNGTTYQVSFVGIPSEAENEAWSALAHLVTEGSTIDSPGTELGDVNGSSPGHSLVTGWRLVNTAATDSVVTTFSTSSARFGVSAEVDVSAGGATPKPKTLGLIGCG